MLAASLLSFALAAVSGTPETQPGDTGEDGVFVSWSNDAFGAPPGPDDHRTNELSLWGRWQGFNVVLDDSMLTDGATGTRSDEITATLGYELVPGLVLGGGYRSRGDYGGHNLQAEAHDAIGDADVSPMTYTEKSGAALGYMVYTTGEMENGVGYRSVTSALLCTDGDSAIDQAAQGVVTWRWLTVWAGTRYQWRVAPDDAGPARRAVDDFENGLWVDAGIRLGWLTFESRYNTREGSAVGTATLYLWY